MLATHILDPIIGINFNLGLGSVFLGYPPLSKGYMCLDPITNKVYSNCYALFNENLFPFAINPNHTNAHIPFSSNVSYDQWFFVSTTPAGSQSTSSFLPHLPLLIPFLLAFSILIPHFLGA